MQTVLWLIVLIIVVALVVAFLYRFYRKATRGIALVRTGFGGKRVVMDGGCLVLPFLHSASEVNMQTLELEVARTGSASLITEDRLRVDTAVQFYVRVEPTADGVATASQTLGRKTFRSEDLHDMLEGKLIGAVQSVIARHTLDHLHENRAAFTKDVRELLEEDLGHNGLLLDTVALTRLDQTPFSALDENNAFNATGMRRLAEVIATNKKQRAAIEADAEVAVRQSQLEATKRRLLLEQEQEEAELTQRLMIERARAEQTAEIAERQAESSRRSEAARIVSTQQVREAEIARDRLLREQEIRAKLDVDVTERETVIRLAEKATEVARAESAAEQARAEQVTSEEAVTTARDVANAERLRRVALIKAKEDAEVDAERTASETDTIRQEAKAKAEAMIAEAEAKLKALLAEAEGLAAKVRAENGLTPELMRMKVEMHRMDRLPQIVAEMVKPAEKIDSIKIHQISGFGGAGGSGGGASSGDGKPLVNQAIDGVLGMALQLPALKKLGEEIGMDFETGFDPRPAKADGGDEPDRKH